VKEHRRKCGQDARIREKDVYWSSKKTAMRRGFSVGGERRKKERRGPTFSVGLRGITLSSSSLTGNGLSAYLSNHSAIVSAVLWGEENRKRSRMSRGESGKNDRLKP